MVYALPAFCLAGALAIGIPVVTTIRDYRDLPAEVPDHFDGYGWPDTAGPRPMIFAVIAAQLIAAGIWALFLHAWLTGNGGVKGVIVSGFAADGLLVTLAWMQSQVLSVALGKSPRILHPFRPTLILVSGIALAVLSAVRLR